MSGSSLSLSLSLLACFKLTFTLDYTNGVILLSYAEKCSSLLLLLLLELLSYRFEFDLPTLDVLFSWLKLAFSFFWYKEIFLLTMREWLLPATGWNYFKKYSEAEWLIFGANFEADLPVASMLYFLMDRIKSILSLYVTLANLSAHLSIDFIYSRYWDMSYPFCVIDTVTLPAGTLPFAEIMPTQSPTCMNIYVHLHRNTHRPWSAPRSQCTISSLASRPHFWVHKLIWTQLSCCLWWKMMYRSWGCSW